MPCCYTERVFLSQRIAPTKVLAAAASAALIAGGIVATAPVASAAPGDRTSFATGSQAQGIAEDSSGALWVANTGSNSISKVALDGTVITYASPIPSPNDIVAGPDGNMWFSSFSPEMGYITPQGAIRVFNIGNASSGIALGPDDNIWFAMPAAIPPSVGKITPSGAVTTYQTGGVPFDFITPGPEGSNRMYLASGATGDLGIVQMNGTYTAIAGPPGSRGSNDIQLINDQVWFIAEEVGTTKLTRLLNDSGFAQIENPALPDPAAIGVGLDGTMWVVDPSPTVAHVTTGGAVVSAYNPGGLPRSSLQAQDGNVWVTVGDGVTRILTGVVPTSSAAPVVQYPSLGVQPPQPPTAGTAMTATNGNWNYAPTSYGYQWQSCATSDATSCANVPGATGQSYTAATTDVGKYVRVGVTAINLNGPSQPAYSALVGVGTVPAPNPNPTPAPATGPFASIGNGATMELDAPLRQKRRQRKTYDVVFSVDDVQGTVVFEFRKNRKKKKDRVQIRTVAIEDGLAEYRWRVPRKWPRKGRTTVTATFVPAAGSPYQAAETRDRVRIRK